MAAASGVPACSGATAPVAADWMNVSGLGHVVAAEAPSGAGPWLLGGGVVTPDGVNHVTIWVAPGPGGPWRTASMHPFAGRDGPNELILGLAGGDVALGSYRAPREGYPRPSTWTAAPGSAGGAWQEVLADRELFGGPSIVAIGDDAGGGLTSGPHGYHIAGTWIGPANRVVATVWSSATGSRWVRDDVDPAFTAGPDAQSYGDDIADGAAGLLMVGSTAEPTRADPTREVGSLWYSGDGSRWRRLPAPHRGPPGSGRRRPGDERRLAGRRPAHLGRGRAAGGVDGGRQPRRGHHHVAGAGGGGDRPGGHAPGGRGRPG